MKLQGSSVLSVPAVQESDLCKKGDKMNFRLRTRKKEPAILSIENIPALTSAMNMAVEKKNEVESHIYATDTKLFEYFLNCPSYDLYMVEADIESAVEILFAIHLENFINDNYESHNSVMKEYLESIIDSEAFNRSDNNYYKKHIGFNRRTFSPDNKRLIDYVSSGNCFISDNEGFRLIVHVPEMKIFSEITSLAGNYRVQLIADGRCDKAKEKCHTFIQNSYQSVYRNIKSGKYVLSASGKPLTVSHVPWDKLKIPAELKTQIHFHVTEFIERLDEFKEAGIKSSRGLIIAGPPGNGKTLLAKIICSNVAVPFFIATSEEFNQLIGGPTIEGLYRTAAKFAPSIILIEDADIFLQQRTYSCNTGALSEFLNVIDGIRENNGIITIITCNRSELLDEAVKNRPKRFDAIIEFNNPEYTERMEILIDKLEKYLSEESREFAGP
jgi:hypothetical protein